MMLPFPSATIRTLTYPFRLARRRPRATAAAVLALCAAGGAAGWGYARHEWRAAGEAVAADRPQEARDRLAVPLLVWRWDPDVHLLAARAARMAGDLPAAEALLKRSLKLAGGATNPIQLEFLLLRVQTGELDRVAPALIEAADQGHPDAPLVFETLAVAYMHDLRYKPAYACLSRWIELRPAAVRAYQYRGWVLERLNNRKGATADYEKALDLDPDLVPARLRVAEMLIEENQAPEAVPHLERLYRLAPDRPDVRARLGMCRYLQGDSAEARRLLESAAPAMPHDPVLHVYLARLDVADGRAAEAERRLRDLLRLDPSDNEARFVLISALALQGKAAEVAAETREHERYKDLLERTNKTLRDLTDSSAATPDECAETGELLVSVGRSRTALYWLHQALEKDPRNQRAHRALAAYYDRTGDAAAAAAHRRRLTDPP